MPYRRKKLTFAISSPDEFLSTRIVNIWNSLPNHVVDVTTVNLFKARLDRFWVNQEVLYDFTADLTGIGDTSVYEICET